MVLEFRQAAIPMAAQSGSSSHMDSIRMVTWLAPGIPQGFFENVRKTLQERLGVSVSLTARTKLSGPEIGSSDPFADNRADLGFLCAPAAVPASVRQQAGFELLELAPLFDDARYADSPHCFCDIVVRESTRGTKLDHLRGMRFGYNDTTSLSGWLGLSAALQDRQERMDIFFGELIHTGGHLTSLEKLRDGSIEVASIDSNVLRTHPGVLKGLKIVDSVGPWPAQPLVVRSALQPHVKENLKLALSACGPWPQWGFIGFRTQKSEQLQQVPIAAV